MIDMRKYDFCLSLLLEGNVLPEQNMKVKVFTNATLTQHTSKLNILQSSNQE
jgi:hypothetical protein